MVRRDAAEASSRLLDEGQILLVTIHLPDGDAHTCDQRQAVTSRGITFVGGLSIGLPQDDGKPAEVTAELPNVGNGLANLVEVTDRSVPITLEVVADSDPDTVLESWPGLALRSAEIGLASGTFTLRQDIPVDEPVSGLRATAQHFPGVEYGF